MWPFDRIARLEALIARASGLAEYLRRASFDHPRGSRARAELAGRLAVVEGRRARLRMLARAARHNARALAGSMT